MMQTMYRPSSSAPSQAVVSPGTAANTVLLISPRADLRQSLARELQSLRWSVQEASSGAEAWLRQEERAAGAVLLDEWLPDLTPREFAQQFLQQFPMVDIVSMEGEPVAQGTRCARRNELLLALRTVDAAAEGMLARDLAGRDLAVRETIARETMGNDAARRAEPHEAARRSFGSQGGTVHSGTVHGGTVQGGAAHGNMAQSSMAQDGMAGGTAARQETRSHGAAMAAAAAERIIEAAASYVLPDVLGATPAMRELGRMIRLAAPHTATVLVEGETGTGKELVAHAVHRLSPRAAKPFVTLNCAAIPEQLLEAELFGHTRGAFTGAVTSRTGRIEAAHGGTLFLDEIGEMPLALQARMLRFLECGEIQRIGENETSRVDVRIVAATHQPLEEHAETGRFRLDLFHRLAVFPVTVPPLRDRMSDLPMLVQHILSSLAKNMPQRSLNADAMAALLAHRWPGNVRELVHAMQRVMILSTEDAEIRREHIVLRSSVLRSSVLPGSSGAV